MEYEIIDMQPKTIVGISAVTRNDAPNIGEVIGGLWQRFYGEGIYNALDKISSYSLGVYSDYENGAEGNYTLTVACEANPEVLPDGAVVRQIPGGRYAKFTVKGNQVTAVAEFWSNLWQMDLPRTFIADYEEYCNGDPDNCEINIYIGLKPVESRCGILCSECGYREETGCKGCVNIDKPFWGESCAVMACCVDKKHSHCGECDLFPCETLNGFAYNPDEGDNGKRIEQCRQWKGGKKQ